MIELEDSSRVVLERYTDQMQSKAFAEQQEAYLQGILDASRFCLDWGILSSNQKNTKNYPLALFLLSKYIDSDSRIKNYRKNIYRLSKSVVAPDALWNVFWYHYKNGRYDEALKLSKLYPVVYADYNIQPKIMFWSAKIHLKTGKKKLARSILHNVASNFPNSYYAFRANAMLKASKKPWHTNANVHIKKDSTFRKFPLNQETKEYRLLNKFVELNDFEAIQNHLKIDDNVFKQLACRKKWQEIIFRSSCKRRYS